MWREGCTHFSCGLEQCRLGEFYFIYFSLLIFDIVMNTYVMIHIT